MATADGWLAEPGRSGTRQAQSMATCCIVSPCGGRLIDSGYLNSKGTITNP
jgi:hypothetical protein